MQREPVHGGSYGAGKGVGQRQERTVVLRELTVLGHPPLAILGDHRERALGEVAKPVREIGRVARDDRLVAVIAVAAEGHLAQHEVAQGIDAVGGDEVERVDDVAERLRHLLAPRQQEAVPKHAFGERQPSRHQEGRPVDRVEANDVLADDVKIHRPEFLARIGFVRKSGHGQVIGQRVDPDIHDVVGVARHRHPPVEIGAADGEVLEARAHEARDLVAAGLGADEVGLALVERQQAVPVGREPEQEVLLLHPGHRRAGGLCAGNSVGAGL